MNTNNIKFIRGYCPGFCSAELLTDNTEPYYAYTDYGTIILDGKGICLSQFEDIPVEKTTEYSQIFSVDSNLAEFIISGLQLTDLDRWVEQFKSNPKTQIKTY
jgi:hypothetical protein